MATTQRHKERKRQASKQTHIYPSIHPYMHARTRTYPPTYLPTYIHTRACGTRFLTWLQTATVQYSDKYPARCNWPKKAIPNGQKLFTASHLEKHADDGHHRKSSVSDFGIKLFGFLSGVRRGQHLESKVSSIRISSWGLFLGDLAESHVGQDLTPSSRVGILGL